MVEDRVALTHPGGALAISADGPRVALGDEAAIKLLTSDALESGSWSARGAAGWRRF